MNTTTLLPQTGLAVLESVINAALRLDPDTVSRLALLAGKVIAVDLRGLDVTLFLLPGSDGLRLMGHYEGEPDTRLQGTPVALLRLNRGRPGEGLFSGEVRIAGDIELGQRMQRVLGGLEIDWEEQLSRLTGDLLARQLGRRVSGLLQWGREAGDRLQYALADYLQEERRDLPSRYEVSGFLDGVDELRSGVDRLQARLQRLEHRCKSWQGN